MSKESTPLLVLAGNVSRNNLKAIKENKGLVVYLDSDDYYHSLRQAFGMSKDNHTFYYLQNSINGILENGREKEIKNAFFKYGNFNDFCSGLPDITRRIITGPSVNALLALEMFNQSEGNEMIIASGRGNLVIGTRVFQRDSAIIPGNEINAFISTADGAIKNSNFDGRTDITFIGPGFNSDRLREVENRLGHGMIVVAETIEACGGMIQTRI